VNYLVKNIKGDVWIWIIVVALSLISILAVYSSTGTLAYKYQGGDTTHYIFRHLFLLAIGFAIMYGTHRIHYTFYSKVSVYLLYLSVPLLLYTLVSGINLNSATRWIMLPGGISFQTSDLAKFALIMYIARFLALNQDNIKDFKTGFRPVIIWIIVICLLIFPANFSTSAMLFAISLVMLFIGRVSSKYLFLLVGSLIVTLSLTILLILAFPKLKEIGRVGTWVARVERFTGNEESIEASDDGNFQSDQAKIAIVTGGITGKGPGKSTQRNFLPHPYSDFIFAIIIEEYGLVGGLIVLFLYLWLLQRSTLIVKKSKHRFAAFTAIGLAFWLVFQALINMAVAVNLFPVTGQTLPLLSMGGSSIFFATAAFGIILSVSRDTDIEKQAKPINKQETEEKTEIIENYEPQPA
jgi:cell division protein FtsW